MRQPLGLIFQAERRSGALLDQRRVLLGHAVEFADGLIHMRHARALLLGCTADLGNQ